MCKLPSIVPWTGVGISRVQFRSQTVVSQFGYRSRPAFSRLARTARSSSSPRNISAIVPFRPVCAVVADSFQLAIRFRPWRNQIPHLLYRPMVDFTLDANMVFTEPLFRHRHRTAVLIVTNARLLGVCNNT